MPFDKKKYYKEYSKNYYLKNRDRKLQYSKSNYHCEICGIDIKNNSKYNHNESKKHTQKVLMNTVNELMEQQIENIY